VSFFHEHAHLQKKEFRQYLRRELVLLHEAVEARRYLGYERAKVCAHFLLGLLNVLGCEEGVAAVQIIVKDAADVLPHYALQVVVEELKLLAVVCAVRRGSLTVVWNGSQ
jgi:hypothetical protein